MKTIILLKTNTLLLLPAIIISCNSNTEVIKPEYETRFQIYESYNFKPTKEFVYEKQIKSIHVVGEDQESINKIYVYYQFVLNGKDTFEDGFIRLLKSGIVNKWE